MNVLYVDDDPEEQAAIMEWLPECFGDEVQVVSAPPLWDITEMGNRVVDDPAVKALIVDQRLKERGTASYTGIELAELIRTVLGAKLPIYILTGYRGDLSPDEWSVENVLIKEDLVISREQRKAVGARVLRNMNVYMDILDEREKRFSELFPKILGKIATTEEEEEFLMLEAGRAKSLAHEFVSDNSLEKKLTDLKCEIDTIRSRLENGV